MDKDKNLKIANFGFTEILSEKFGFSNEFANEIYKAPETRKTNKNDTMADIWFVVIFKIILYLIYKTHFYKVSWCNIL